MAAIKRLPDSEFEIMEIIWENPPPITTLQIMEKMEPDRGLPKEGDKYDDARRVFFAGIPCHEYYSNIRSLSYSTNTSSK